MYHRRLPTVRGLRKWKDRNRCKWLKLQDHEVPINVLESNSK